MLIRKRLVSVGSSQAVIVPFVYLQSYEMRHGKRLGGFDMTIKGETVTLSPIPEGSKGFERWKTRGRYNKEEKSHERI